MHIPTESIGSRPRPLELLDAIALHGNADPALDALFKAAIRDTIETSTSRETAVAKIWAHVQGTAQAADIMGGGR